MKGLGCESRAARWVVVLSRKTVWTYGTCRSEWRVWFETYHRALVIVLRSLDWYGWMRSMLDLEAHPHSSIPYVHTGFSTVLQMRSLFSNDRGEWFPMSQYISRVLRSSCLRFVFTWSFQFRRLSKWSPKYYVFDRLCLGHNCLVDIHWGAMFSPESECYVWGLTLIYLQSPLPSPIFNSVQVILEIGRG